MQAASSGLYEAVKNDLSEIVKYLTAAGGKELLMMPNAVSGYINPCDPVTHPHMIGVVKVIKDGTLVFQKVQSRRSSF